MTGRSVLQVTTWNSPYLGNFMASELTFARSIRARFGLGTHFVLGDGALAYRWRDDLDSEGATWSVLPAGRHGWRDHLRRAAEECDAALVHTHFTAADIQAAGVASAAGVPCIWHVRTGFNGYPPRQRAKDLLKMRIIARRQVDRIIAVSPWLGELMRRRGAPPDRIEVLPNPVIVDRFEQLPDRAWARERFGLRPEATVILALGWWPAVKGVDVLIDALTGIAEARPEMEALLVGEEHMREFLAQRLPLQPRWLQTSGFVEDAASLFAAADIFVSASRHEGQSSAIGEALACGLPVVMSDIAGTAGWADAPGISTFPSQDSAALATQLELVLAETPQARWEAGAANRPWVASQHGPEVWCDRMCAIYGALLSSTGETGEKQRVTGAAR
jgi:glycosyltransferase involved in cell wall biosynthesis